MNFAPMNRFSEKIVDESVRSCTAGGIHRYVFTDWGDDGGECPYFSALPALMHAAATAEGLSETEMKEKFRAIVGEEYDAFLELDLPNHVFGADKMVGSANYSKNRLYDDCFLAILSLNAEGADGGVYREYAERLHRRAREGCEFRYLFETMAGLCDALAIKFDLADRTRSLYAAGDKEGLRRLAENEYTALLSRLDAFYQAFRTQWYTVNKTYGFEIQDARLGGLMQRIKSCRERLLAFCDGDIDKIEELSEPVLSNDGGNVPYWREMLTACVV